jgi:hypothetical protein
LNTDIATVAPGAGAGAGNVSLAVPTLLGLNVPLTICVASPIVVAAESSKVRFTLTMSPPPPTSDMIRVFCPAGPTSRISMSSGKVWLIPVRSTVTLVTLPVKPATEMLDG